MQGLLYSICDRWIKQLDKYVKENRPIPLWHASQCFTLEATSMFSYGSSNGSLEQEDLLHPLFLAFENLAVIVTVFQRLPIVQIILGKLQTLIPFGFPDVHRVSH